MVDKSDIERMVAEVDRENSLFADKSPLDPFRQASEIVGREREAKELVRAVTGGRGFAAPFVSVYGRSGSGKSSVVRFVCDSLLESGKVCAYAFVNLRLARTVAGCAMLVLEQLSREPVESHLALHEAMQSISQKIKFMAFMTKRPFVLVLDEFDSIFLDTRGRPSDFCYRLLEMQEYLRQHNCLLTIVAISNSAMAELGVDDRVRSRMGSEAEVPFGAYTKEEVLKLLHLRAAKAIAGCEDSVLERCAEVCAEEHGDARRAMELFKSACELAGAQGQKLCTKHIEVAAEKLQKDRVVVAMAGSSRHLKIACMALVRLSHLTGDEWHSTSVLYRQYCLVLGKESRPLTYRRVSEIFGELVGAGVATSATASRGRGHGGYGTRYRLAVSPELVGAACFAQWWADLAGAKSRREEQLKELKQQRFEVPAGQPRGDEVAASRTRLQALRSLEMEREKEWKEFVGVE